MVAPPSCCGRAWPIIGGQGRLHRQQLAVAQIAVAVRRRSGETMLISPSAAPAPIVLRISMRG
jgi:hypothetical protein